MLAASSSSPSGDQTTSRTEASLVAPSKACIKARYGEVTKTRAKQGETLFSDKPDKQGTILIKLFKHIQTVVPNPVTIN